jgi:hypothetical protein
MRPWTAGQKRFSFRFSQIAQLTNISSSNHYHTQNRLPGGAGHPSQRSIKATREHRLGGKIAKKADFCGLSWFLNEKNRIKCG